MNKYVRIDTKAASYIFETDSEETALLLFANAAGYDSYAELAVVIGKPVDEAKADLVISHATADDLVRDVVEEGIASGITDTWKVDDLANLNGIDREPLVAAADAMHDRRSLENLNAEYVRLAKDRVRNAGTLGEVYSALLLVHRYLGDHGMNDWRDGGITDEVPTFGPEPVGLRGSVWSWDAEQVLVQDEDSTAFSISIEHRVDGGAKNAA